jgi:hypothetical protein
MHKSAAALAWVVLSLYSVTIPEDVRAQVQTPKADTSANDTWHAIGFNNERIATSWVQLKSYESLNENSFRLNAKFTNDRGVQIVGRIDVNCKNKDFYFRPNGILNQNAPWAAIPEGSGVHGLAINYCRNTSARSAWGYTPETAYLWDAPPPEGDPANANGDWVEAINSDEVETYYNTSAKMEKGVVVYAFYMRTKKGDRSAAQPGDTAKYYWVRNSCTENLGSAFEKYDPSLQGHWMPPTSGHPGGANMITKKLFCKN